MTAITRRSGTEGPSYDPYGWEEYTIERNGKEATIRISGLASWLEIDGERFQEFDVEVDADLMGHKDRGMAMLDRLLERHLGYDLGTFLDAYSHYESKQPEDPMGCLGDYV